MRLHNFLVDYLYDHCDKEQQANEKKQFTEDTANSDTLVIVVCNDVGTTDRISNQKMNNQHICIQLRDKLIIYFMDHDMHRARKEKWVEDEHTYITRTD